MSVTAYVSCFYKSGLDIIREMVLQGQPVGEVQCH